MPTPTSWPARTHTPDVIEELDRRLGRPVVTSSQATLWYYLRACGLPDAVSGFGELGRDVGLGMAKHLGHGKHILCAIIC